MLIPGILFLLFLLSAQSGFAQEKARTLEDYSTQARELEKKEDFAGAERVYLQALQVFPMHLEIRKRLAIIYQTELKFPESIEIFHEILRADTQYPEANFYLGLSHLGLNQYLKAIEAFNKELEANSNYRRAHYFAADALLSLDRKAEAIQHLEALVRGDPNDTRAWYQLARISKSLSMQAIKKLSVLDPESLLFHALRAESYMEDEKYTDAIREYQEIQKKQPDFAGVHFSVGELYWKTDRNEEAERELRLALREDPNHPMANYYLGELLLRNQRAKEAIPLLQISVAADPSFLAAQFQVGKCYLAEGQLEEALRVFSKVAELEPESKITHYQLAQVYARLKNDEKRKHHLAIFEKLNKAENEKKLKRSARTLQLEELDREELPQLSSPLSPSSATFPTSR